jgi:ATP-dependent DNA helicase Rep
MSQLNPRQQEAMQYVSGPLLVLAGAGSGKTSVITRKIAYLIEECQMPAERITAVTFTNKAAREMKARVQKLLPSDKTKGLTLSLIHI